MNNSLVSSIDLTEVNSQTFNYQFINILLNSSKNPNTTLEDSLSAITSVNLTENEDSNNVLNLLRNVYLTNLTSLNLSNTIVTTTTINTINVFNIIKLDLSNSCFSPNKHYVLDVLSILSSLRDLNLSDNSITDKDFDKLLNLNLSSLDVSWNNLTEKSMYKLHQYYILPFITRLNIRWNKIPLWSINNLSSHRKKIKILSSGNLENLCN